MASLFSGPPKPPSPPKVPSENSPAVIKARLDMKRALSSKKNREILTSPTGVETPAPTQAKTLLGA